MSQQKKKPRFREKILGKFRSKERDSKKPDIEKTFPCDQTTDSSHDVSNSRSIEDKKDIVAVDMGDTSVENVVETTEQSIPRNLWKCAFDKLSKGEKDTLQQLKMDGEERQISDATIVNEVIDQTKEKYEIYLKGGKIGRGKGKEGIDIRGKAYKILDSALGFQKLVADIAVFDPTGHASSAWTIISLGLNMIKNDHDLLNSIFDAAEYLSGIVARYTSIAIHYRDRNFTDSDELQNVMIEVYVAILSYSAAVADAQNVNFAKRVLKSITPLTGQPLTKLKSDISGKDETVRKWTELIEHLYRKSEAEELLNKIEENIKVSLRIESQVLTAEEERILEWLHSDKISTRHLQSDKARTQGTCQWLLPTEKYRHWLASPSILWLYGVVGCGKTVLCSTVIRNLQDLCRTEPNTKLVYWYFQFDVPTSQSMYNMMRSFIRQLSSSPLANSVMDLWRSHKVVGSDPSFDDLAKVLGTLIEGFNGQIFIVLDALDECPYPAAQPDRRDLLAYISDLSHKHHKNLHILATSRDEPDINKVLAPNPSINIETFVEGDVRLFVKSALDSGELKDYSDKIKNKIKERLVSMNEARFRWADLQIQTLILCNNKEQLLESLRTIPETLEKTYEAALDRIPARDINLARSILMWLTFSFRPLTLKDIGAAVSIKKPEFALRICSSLLVTLIHEDTEDVIKLAHFSVKEFLMSRSPVIDKEAHNLWYRFTDEEAHVEIAQTSIQTLLSTNSMQVSDEKLAERPLLPYSAIFWHRHMRAVHNDTTRLLELRKSVQSLFNQENSTAYLNWLHTSDPDNAWRGFVERKNLEEYPQPLYYASLLGLDDSVDELLREGADVMTKRGKYEQAYVAAAVRGHSQIAAKLLDKYTEVKERHMTIIVWEIESNIIETLEVVLNKGVEENHITKFMVLMTLVNDRQDEIMKFLLARIDIQFTRGAIEATIASFGHKMIELLLEHRAGETQITEEVLKRVAGSRDATLKMKLLFEMREEECHITEGVLKAAVGGDDAVNIMELLFAMRGEEIHITEGVLKAAAKNDSAGEDIMDLLLTQRGEDIEITEGVLEAAAINERSGAKIMELLFNKRGGDIQITERILRAAATKQRSGAKIMELLFNKRGGNIQITERILKAAANNIEYYLKDLELVPTENAEKWIEVVSKDVEEQIKEDRENSDRED